MPHMQHNSERKPELLPSPKMQQSNLHDHKNLQVLQHSND